MVKIMSRHLKIEKENQTIIKSLNMYGRVPEQWELLNEIERLNNIVKEFDKWLLGQQMMFYKSSDGERLIRYGETKNKWIKLKGE